MCGSAVANYFVSMCPKSVSNVRACFCFLLVQLGSAFPVLVLCIFLLGVLFSSATVRVLCSCLCFVMCVASVGQVKPHTRAVFDFVCKTVRCVLMCVYIMNNN